MEIPKTENSKQEMCMVRIVFPVMSGADFIERKEKIDAAFSDIPNVHIQYSLSKTPLPPQ